MSKKKGLMVLPSFARFWAAASHYPLPRCRQQSVFSGQLSTVLRSDQMSGWGAGII